MTEDSSDVFLRQEHLPRTYADLIDHVHRPLAVKLGQWAQAQRRPCIVGISGAQGSGKSTLTKSLQRLLAANGVSSVAVSLDDFYLSRAQRESLAVRVHPLFKTRGVPGTHDVRCAIEVLVALRAGRPATLPTFHKGTDDVQPRSHWRSVTDPVQVILFEGWCVGAEPQPEEELEPACNELEREFDQDGTWRRVVNAALADSYRELFALLDRQIFLQAPSFEAVHRWRCEQEYKLRKKVSEEGLTATAVMTDEELAVFICHYERITTWMLQTLPRRSDVVIRLDHDRNVVDVLEQTHERR